MKDTTAIVCTSAIVSMLGVLAQCLIKTDPVLARIVEEHMNGTLDKLQVYYITEKS